MKIEVRPSPIHGCGVFARRPIRKGERIGQYLARRTNRDGRYVLWVEHEETKVIKGYEGFGRLRFLNHRRKPNSKFDGLELYALKPIQPGEEITCHYGDEWSGMD
jgi:SET domain-containing protein